MRTSVAAPAICALIALSGCAETAPAPALSLPAPGAVFDYQLGGPYDPVPDASLVVRDSTAEPSAGRYSVCYVNGFQTQPSAPWPDELLLHDASGDVMVDPDWPDENIVDISSDARRDRAAQLIAPTLDRCAEAGYDAVELDNLDSWTRSDDRLTPDDAVAFARLLVEHAHGAGLAVAQKNSADLDARGRTEVGFDFAITEECAAYRECTGYAEVYDGRVFDIEYTDSPRPFTEVCADPERAPSTVLRDRELVPDDADGFVYEHC